MNATAEVDLSIEGTPEVGGAVIVTLSRAGRPVAGQPVVAARPAGAVDATQHTTGTTDSAGHLSWTPDRAGFTSLELGDRAWAVVVSPGPAERLSGGLLLCAVLITLVAGQLWLRNRERA